MINRNTSEKGSFYCDYNHNHIVFTITNINFVLKHTVRFKLDTEN